VSRKHDIDPYFVAFFLLLLPDVHPNGPADRAGLRVGDKILQCNEYDFTIVTHKKAIDYIKKGQVANLLVARRGVTNV
jgi:predicted metalloprotease with PDZ domain